MEFLIGYSFFCLTTALTACIVLMQPVLSELEPDNNLAENKFMTYLVFTIMSIIMAPVIFIACIVPSKTEQFKIALAKSIRG